MAHWLEALGNANWVGLTAAFIQVVLIDLMLAADNAVAIGMAAYGLPKNKRRTAMILGLGVAVVLRSGMAVVATQLLQILGLLLAGGLLLAWVGWNMWRDLRAQQQAEETAEDDPNAAPKKPKTILSALIQILIADISMSLDNILAVAGAARAHPVALIFGLVLSIALTGFAAAAIVKLLEKMRWLGYLGLIMILVVAGQMVGEGASDLLDVLKHSGPVNWR